MFQPTIGGDLTLVVGWPNRQVSGQQVGERGVPPVWRSSCVGPHPPVSGCSPTGISYHVVCEGIFDASLFRSLAAAMVVHILPGLTQWLGKGASYIPSTEPRARADGAARPGPGRFASRTARAASCSRSDPLSVHLVPALRWGCYLERTGGDFPWGNGPSLYGSLQPPGWDDGRGGYSLPMFSVPDPSSAYMRPNSPPC
jgi:hypothetical protein